MQTPFSRSSLILALVGACGFGAMAGSFSRTSAVPATVAPSAVAVVNIREVMRAVKEFSVMGNMQKESAENIKKQIAAKQTELKTLLDNTKLLDHNSAEYQKLDDQIAEKSMQLEAWVNFQKKQLARQEAAMMLGLYRKVCTRAQKLAEDKGYDLLLAETMTNDQLKELRLEEANQVVNGERTVLWSRKTANLTEDLRAAMDNEFAQRGAPATAPAVGPVAPAPKP